MYKLSPAGENNVMPALFDKYGDQNSRRFPRIIFDMHYLHPGQVLF
jgi:hypothetical protein